MESASRSEGRLGARLLDLDPAVLEELQAALPAVAARTVAAVTSEVPEYGSVTAGTEMGANIEGAVQMALAGFLRMVAEVRVGDPGTPLGPALEAAYALGRGEARNGRTMDGLLAAYRVGARVAWREQSDSMVRSGVPTATVAGFAELVFAYIDELSAASAAGHRDELATTGRVREQYLERLGRALLDGEAPEELAVRAERADWVPPETLTVVVLPAAHVRTVVQLLGPGSLTVAGDVAGSDRPDDSAVLLVPDVESRAALLGALRGRSAVVGPTRPWTEAAASYRRVARAGALLPVPPGAPLDTDEHLVTLVLGADPLALDDLRARALAPLSALRPAAAERLAETLRSWLLHQGRREEVAADLHVHPQTVRYRMTQLRELFGDRLAEPAGTLELLVALAVPVDAAQH